MTICIIGSTSNLSVDFFSPWRSIIFLLHKNNIKRILSGLTKAADLITYLPEFHKIRISPTSKKVTQNFERLGIYGRKILKWILKIQDAWALTGFIWPRIGTNWLALSDAIMNFLGSIIRGDFLEWPTGR